MIFDSLNHLDKYENLSPLFKEAFIFIKEQRYLGMQKGDKLNIVREEDPKAGFALLISYKTEDEKLRKYEAHKKYIDIQCILEGEEKAYWAVLEDLDLTDPYDDSKDAAFYQGKDYAGLELKPGKIAIFFPHDAHKPNCNSGNTEEEVKKLVIKIPAS